MLLCCCLCLGLWGCGGEKTAQTDPTPETVQTEETEPVATEQEEEAKVEKILIVGNSHSGDTFWLLQQVFDAHYDKDVMLGYLYYSGCTIIKHLQFALNNDAVYAYRLNYTGKDRGVWDDTKNVTLAAALADQKWDVIIFQADEGDMRLESLNLSQRRQLEDYVRDYLTEPYVFMWNTTWSDAGNGPVYDPSWPVQPSATYAERLTRDYGWDPARQFDNMVTQAKNYILTDDTYVKAICPGAAIMYTILTMELPQTDIYRDYTHLTEFGRLIASYAFYTQYTGQMVDEIRIDVIPQRLRSSRFKTAGDVVVTQEMKDIILEAVGYAFEHPFEVPQK